jgi:hypothetical protein
VLGSLARDDEVHELGLGLKDLYAVHPTPAVADIFLGLYERGPCSLCRTNFVRRLIESAALPEWKRREAAHDADPDTRAAVRALDG